jgi:hypothetical protein
MADATAQVTALRAQLAASVLQQVNRYAQNLATVVLSNPHGEILALLDRPDVAQALTQSLAAARSQALAALQQAWAATGADSASPVLASLAQDVQRAYNEAPGLIREAAVHAWHSVPQQSFTVGVSTPGTNPAYQTAVQRAQAVRDALDGPAQALALRNGLSVVVAGSSGRTEATLAEAIAQPDAHLLGKRWVASMDGKDPKSCAWCRRLHGTVVPLDAQFPHPVQIGDHKPPKPYRGRLDGPELHPHCQCFLEIVPLVDAPVPVPAPAPVPPEELPDMVSSEDIAAMPEERYQSMRHFLASALHELAQVIRAILGIRS